MVVGLHIPPQRLHQQTHLGQPVRLLHLLCRRPLAVVPHCLLLPHRMVKIHGFYFSVLLFIPFQYSTANCLCYYSIASSFGLFVRSNGHRTIRKQREGNVA